VTVVSQITDLLDLLPGIELQWAMTAWVVGITSATLAWGFAALTAQPFAVSARVRELWLEAFTILLFLISVLAFASGFFILVVSLPVG
jgi:hypothetical protein